MGARKSPYFPDVDFLLPLGPAKLLSDAGFRRSGRNFIRESAASIASVYFRTSRFGASTFEVVLSTFLPVHHELVSGRPFPTNPFPGKAVALVTRDVWTASDSGAANSWWQLNFGIEIEPLAKSLTLELERALPFFNDWSDPDEARGRLLSGRGPEAPARLGTAALVSLFLHAGDFESANRALREIALPAHLLSAMSARLWALHQDRL